MRLPAHFPVLGTMNDDAIYHEAMSEAQRLGLISGSIATDRCQCSTCSEVFTTESNFDRHLTPGRNSDDGLRCQPPATVRLIQHGGGWWHQPGPDTSWNVRGIRYSPKRASQNDSSNCCRVC